MGACAWDPLLTRSSASADSSSHSLLAWSICPNNRAIGFAEVAMMHQDGAEEAVE